MACGIETLLICIFIPHLSGFMPGTDLNLDDDFTRGEIVEIAIKYTLEDSSVPELEDIMSNETLFAEFRSLGVTTERYENRSDVLHVVGAVTDYTTLTDVESGHDPAWTFSDEKIKQGHELVRTVRQRLITELSKEIVNSTLCRRLLGQVFHLIMSFYSNTNWVEGHPNAICEQLGIQHVFPYTIPSADVPTCKPCGAIQHDCHNNMLVRAGLTSGYWDRTVDDDSTELKTQRESPTISDGKCRHGGVTDHSGGSHVRHTVPGGINKMSGNPELSPHYFLHERAAIMSVLHCIQFMKDPVFGLKTLVGKKAVQEMLVASTGSVHVFIDDLQSTVESDTLESMLQMDTTFKLLKMMTLTQACTFSNQKLLVIIRLGYIDTSEDLPKECLTENTHVYHITPNYKYNHRVRRSLTTTVGMNLYNIIAQVSGGSVYHTTKTDIGAVVDLIKETITSKPPVSIMKFLLKRMNSDTFTIPVDVLMFNVTIKIQSTISSPPTYNLYRPDVPLRSKSRWREQDSVINRPPAVNLYRPDGTEEYFRNHSTATKQSLGRRLAVVKLIKPKAGSWKFTRTSSLEYEVEISAKTDLDFSYKFMQTGPGGFGEYPLVGRPIAGANTSVQVSVPLYDKVTSVDSIVVLDESGATQSTEPLHNIGGRRGKSLFKTHILIPANEFKLAIEGKDKANNLFRRMDPRLISTLAIKLEVLGVSGTLYINRTVTLTYRVTNVGGGRSTVVVKISDDKGFSETPTTHRHHLSTHQNVTGSFNITAGPDKGETVTVTVSANADGAPANKVQYSVQRLTVEENITRAVDTESPMCNVTSILGTCDVGKDLCTCDNQTWSMEAAIGDVGFGLQSVFVSGAGNKSLFDFDNFTVGHTVDKGVIRASLRADCCHQKATITVVDLAGNVGLCNVTLTPNFVAPDPKLCHSQPSVGNGSISCNTTSTTGSCDFRNMTCTGDSCKIDRLCHTKNWTMHAKIGNHSNTIHQFVPINVGNASKLVHNKDLVDLTLDCCQTDALVKFVDIAGNVGQCHTNVTVLMNEATTTQATTQPSTPHSSPSSPSSLLPATKQPSTPHSSPSSPLPATKQPSTPHSSPSSSLPVAIIAGASAGGVALIVASVAIVCLIKKHTTNQVKPLKT